MKDRSRPAFPPMQFGPMKADERSPTTEERLAAYARRLEKRPADTRVRMKYAEGLWQARRFREAIQQVERACTESPDGWLIHHTLGIYCFQFRDYEKALLAFRVAISLIQGDAEPGIAQIEVSSRMLISEIHRRMNRREEALTELRKALGITRTAGLEYLQRNVELCIRKYFPGCPVEPWPDEGGDTALG